MSLRRTARRISLPALVAVVLAAALLAITPGRATPAGASADTAAAGFLPDTITGPTVRSAGAARGVD